MPDKLVSDIANAAAENGWLFAAFTGVWAFTLRLLIGRHYKAMDTIQHEIGEMKEDIAAIKGRLQERDRYGRHTWPGDTE